MGECPHIIGAIGFQPFNRIRIILCLRGRGCAFFHNFNAVCSCHKITLCYHGIRRERIVYSANGEQIGIFRKRDVDIAFRVEKPIPHNAVVEQFSCIFGSCSQRIHKVVRGRKFSSFECSVENSQIFGYSRYCFGLNRRGRTERK